MPGDEEQIRDLIERWAAAVHEGDMTTVLAGESTPYRETWPPFFEWQASGSAFEIVSLGLRKWDGRWLVAHEHHSFCA